MSYDIELTHPVTGEVIELPEKHHMTGGTYQVGGSTEASLNITYNYGPLYRDCFGNDGIRSIYGLTGADSINMLQASAEVLGDDLDDDYWKPTEGNAKAALLQLIALAKMRPDGVWKGD